ncbi:MAG TPA: aspartate/glutamate racemase family protein [Xanthobacteraceae bacterium]|nr:aspartate/glutamate racemase family protein [Xanthobacteraceae bacterium]
MTSRVFLGMLTPSSNTVLEPVTTAMIAGLPEVTAHFSRFKVTEIALSAPALAQFDDSEILRAAELLAHAKVNVIAWNGTSSGWLGFARDVQLCERIRQATGIPACTAMLALNEILEKTGARTVGFVTPYLDDVQARINANYEGAGWKVVADRHLRMQDNFSFSTVTADQMRDMTRAVAAARPDAIAIICTNMRGAPLAAELEAKHGIPIYDTVSTTVWKSLKIAGVDTTRVQGWGRIFQV